MTTSRWNIPNAPCASRLFGVPLLFVLVDRAPVEWFAAVYALLGHNKLLQQSVAL